MKILVVKLNGGLGNQLFQYATARNLCVENGISNLYFDVRNFENDYLGRKLAIQNLNIKGRALKNNFFLKAFTKNTKLNKLLSFLGLYKQFSEEKFLLHNLSHAAVFTYLDGFWQSYKYFENIRQILLKELFSNDLPTLPDWIINENTVAVGVRRTDYLIDERYGFIGLKYYESAFALIKTKIKDPLFIFFSDDINWCKENFTNEKQIFFHDEIWGKDYLKLLLMSKCKHQVVSNSSFYWWSAWLNTNPDKIVVRPSDPFKDPQLFYESYYPEEWLITNNSNEAA